MYTPQFPPPGSDAAALSRFLAGELQRISQAVSGATDAIYLNVLYAAPAKTKAGMVCYFDGVRYNPGSGEGIYRRSADNTAWVFLG